MSLLVRVGARVRISRYRTIDISDGIDFASMVKSSVMLKVMYKIDLPRKYAPAHNRPLLRKIRGGPARLSALHGSTIFPCPREPLDAPHARMQPVC